MMMCAAVYCKVHTCAGNHSTIFAHIFIMLHTFTCKDVLRVYVCMSRRGDAPACRGWADPQRRAQARARGDLLSNLPSDLRNDFPHDLRTDLASDLPPVERSRARCDLPDLAADRDRGEPPTGAGTGAAPPWGEAAAAAAMGVAMAVACPAAVTVEVAVEA